MILDPYLNTYLNTIIGIKVTLFALLILNSITKKKYKYIKHLSDMCRFLSTLLISVLVMLYFPIFTKAVDLVVPVKVAQYAFIYGLSTFIGCIHQVFEMLP